MANWIKYGKYWISAGIAVGGVLWFNRPGDRRIMGEDPADLFEAAQERKVIAYLEGEQAPDYAAANNGSSNSVASLIKYATVLDIAGVIRGMALGVNKVSYTTVGDFYPDGGIYWITNAITGDTFEPSVMEGGYMASLSTNEHGVVTERYSYDTNTCMDAMVTTETRTFSPSRGAAYQRGPYSQLPEPVTTNNTPVSQHVFSENETGGIKDAEQYLWWPFDEAYQFPWEQWSWRDSTRVALLSYASNNVSWTNVCWIGTNSLSVAFTPHSADPTNGGFSAGCFYSVSGARSVPFVYVQPPSGSSPIYLSNYPGGPFETDYSINKAWSAGWQVVFTINKDGIARSQSLAWDIVYGDYLFMFSSGGGPANEALSVQAYPGPAIPGYPSPTPTNSLSVLKIWVPAVTNVLPIYVAISVKDGSFVATNAYFQVTSDIATSSPVTGTATTNALVPEYYGDYALATDDRRITTNKLYELREALTNLTRTVYFRGTDALVSTNCIVTTYGNTGGTLFTTNYTGTALPIGYYDFGDGSGYIAGLLSGAAVVSVATNTVNVGTVFSESFFYDANKTGIYDENDGNPYWSSYNWIEGAYERIELEHKGVSLEYPSEYAVTNGYVSGVKVYALYENATESLDIPGYGGLDGDTNVTFDVGGEYWNTRNLGTAIDGVTINIPSEEPPVTRTSGTHRTYGGEYPYQDSFRNMAVYTKIYECSNPTNRITFDIPKPEVTGADFASRYAYSYDKDTNPDLYYEHFKFDYKLGYSIRIAKFMIVVDWKFKHLGNGFTAVTNTPAWRQ